MRLLYNQLLSITHNFKPLVMVWLCFSPFVSIGQINSTFTATGATGLTPVSETVDGITVTISSDFNARSNSLVDSNDKIFEARGNTVTVTFSSPVDLNGLDMFSNNSLLRIEADFIPGQGPNSAVNNIECDPTTTFSPVPVSLNWTHISSFSINVRGFGAFNGNPATGQIQLDDLSIITPATNAAPVASGLNISGTFTVGQTLMADYTFTDSDEDTEAGSTIQWYRSDDNAGTNKTSISGATFSTYKLALGDLNKYISFIVTPNDGIEFGSAVESSFDGPVAPDVTPPTVLSLASEETGPTNLASLNYTLTFDEGAANVTTTDFMVSTVSGDAAGNVSTVIVDPNNGEIWTIGLTGLTGAGEIRLDVISANGITDESGNGGGTNGTVAAFQGEVLAIDRVAPSVTISSTENDPTVSSPIQFTATFNEEIDDESFISDDITVSNGTVTDFTTTDYIIYSITVTPTSAGIVEVSILENAVTDIVGNGNTASNNFEIDFDIPAISYGATFDLTNGITVVGSPFPNPEQLAVSTVEFSTDGSRMFTAGTVRPEVNRFNLSTPFEISTASFGGTSQDLGTFNQQRTPTDVEFSTDGSRLFVAGFNPNVTIQQYNLSAFNIHSASAGFALNVNSQDTRPTGIAFSSDGMKMFISGQTSGLVHQYGLTNAYELSTATYSNISFDVSDNSPQDIVFSSNGLKMFILGGQGDNIKQFGLTAAFDISAPTLENSVGIGSQESSPTGLAFSTDGTKVYVTGSSGDDVNQYAVNLGGFTEATADDGFLEGSLVMSITDDTFANAGGTLTFNSDYSISNLPDGLTPILTVSVDGSSAVLTLTGNASGNNNSNDVSALQFTFENSAFTNASASQVTNAINASSDIGIDFIQFPTVEIQNAPTNTNTAFTATFQFDEDVTGFELSDIIVGNGTPSAFEIVDANTYTALITPTAEGAVTIDVVQAAAINSENNESEAAVQVSVNFDTTNPIVTIQNAPANTNMAFTASFEFSEDVIGFDLNDLIVANGSASVFETIDAMTYSALITPIAEGNVTIDINAGAATDDETNGSLAATQTVTNYDTTTPTVEFLNVPSSTNGAFTATIEFSEDVQGFEVGNITIGNAATSDFAATDGSTYTVLITPSGSDAVTLSIAESVATDLAGNGNSASAETSTSIDTTAPTVELQGIPENTNGPFTVTVEFSENVSGFELADIEVANGTASEFTAIDGKTFTAVITGTADGLVTLDIKSGAATDAASNGNSAAVQVSSNFDTIAPTVEISEVPGNTNAPFTAKIEFSEDVTGFELVDISVGNGIASDFVTTEANSYTVLITPTEEGQVTLDIGDAVATDLSTNENEASIQSVANYDPTAPTITLTAPESVAEAFSITIEFSEDVTGFELTDIVVGNGVASDFVEVDAKNYTALITPDGEGTVTLDVEMGSAIDIADNGNDALPQVSVLFDTTPSFTLSGSVVDVEGTPINDATIKLKQKINGAFQDVAEVILNSVNTFVFPQLEQGDYAVEVIPGATINTTYFVTYSGDVLSLAEATITQLDSDKTITVTLIDQPPAQGNGGDEEINGTLSDPNNTGRQLQSGALVGVDVFLLDADGNIVGFDTTDENGEFTFINLLPGDYTLSVDYEGLPVEGAAITVNEGEPTVVEVEVTETGIVTRVAEVTSLNDEVFARFISTYPNPFSSHLTISMTNEEFGLVDLKIFDQKGVLLRHAEFDKTSVSFDYNLNLSNINHGLMFLQIKQGSQYVIKKLIRN
ncbi:MAG: Ig-like domain-containing protein [Cyclobacteriaceae bacterium]